MAPHADRRVLAVDPTSRGFGYAVLEGPARLVDWGVTEGLQADNRHVTARVGVLLSRYSPDAVIVEDVASERSRRCMRVKDLVGDLRELAGARGASVATVSVSEVRRMFRKAQARNKEQIADTIANHFPELFPWRPPFRKPWMSEDARMAIFDAVAFALAYFYFDEKEGVAA